MFRKAVPLARSLAAVAIAGVFASAPVVHADDSFAVTTALSARAVFSCSDLTMSDGTVDSMTISGGVTGNHGDIASNGNVRISGGTVNGDATAGPGKAVNLSGSGRVTGTKSSASTAVNCTPTDLSSLVTTLPSSNDNSKIPLTGQGKNPLGGTTHTDFTLSGGDTITLLPGTYYFTKFTVSGGSSITLTGVTKILCTGKVDINGGSFNNALPYRFRFWVSGAGPFTLSGGSILKGFVYAPAAASTVSSSTLVGGLFANQVTISGGSAHITRAVDDIPPAVTITSPADGSGVSDPVHVLVKGTVSDDQTAASVAVNGQPAAVASDGTWQITLDLSGTPSPATVTAVATDLAGNVSPPARVTLVTALPAISLTSPAPGSLLATRTVNLQGGAGSASTVTVNGFPAALAGGTWSLPGFDLGADDGQHTLRIIGTNAAGSTLITPILTTDTTPPTITASSSPLPNAAGWNRSDVTVSFACSDATSGVATCPAAVVISADTASQNVSGSSTDKVGNASQPVSKTVKLDKTAPLIAITTPAGGASFNSPILQVSGTVSDALSGVAGVTCNGATATFAGGLFNCSVTLAAGDNTITAVATDVAGNPATTTVHAIYNPDSSAPVITITSPANGTFTRLATVTVTGTATDDVAVKSVTVNGTPATLTNGAWTATITLPSGDGPKTITAVATDSSDKQTPASVQVTLDTTPPVLTITAPAAGSIVSNPALTITGTVADALSGVASVTCNGVAATVNSEAFTCSVSLVEGLNTIAIAAADKVGNQGALQPPFTITLDSRAPEITIGAPAIGACIDATTLTVSGTATDPRIASVKVNDVPATLDSSKGTWTATLPVSEGKLLITVVAADTVGHSSTVTRGVVIDRTAPVIDVRESGALFTAALLNRAVSLLVRATDDDPNVALTVRLDGAAYTSGAAIGEGAHQLVVSATDCAGHKSDKTIAFTIDLTPPTIRNLNPGNGATVGTTPNAISGNTDTDAARVEIEGSSLAATPNGDGSFTIAAVPFADGVNRFTLKATDKAGNSSETAYVVTVHTSTPVVSILESGSPLVAGTLFNRSVTPEIKSSDSTATIAATLNSAPFTIGTTLTADGNYSLGATATDAQTHVGHADTTFVIDRTPPVVKITAPLTGVVTTDHIEVRGTAGDAVSAAVNGIAVTLAADGSFILPSLPLDFGGTTAIVATARDRAGNVGRDEVDVTPADSRPGIILTYPPDHSLTNRPATEVLGRTLSAPPDGVVTVGTTALNTISVPVDPSGAFRASGYVLVEGDNTITASVKNRNGTTNSATVHVTGDFTPPSLTILESGQPLADDARFATQAVLTLSASDSGSGGVTTELTIDGTKVTSLPATITLSGGHSASATARDAAGNESHVDRTFFIGTSTGVTGCALSDFDPIDGSVVLSSTATLVGRSGGAIGVKVNGVAAAVADGSFRATVELPNEGANSVTIACTDGNGNPTGTPVTITLNRITGDPSISIDTPAEGFATGSDTIAVTGTVGPGVVSADVNGANATITGSDISVSRPFIVANVRLAAGLNVLAAHGKNGAGRVATASRRVFLLKDLPVISVSSPLSGTSTGSASVTVSGTWTNLDPATIVVTNLASGLIVPSPGIAASDTTGTFNAGSVALIPGDQTLKVTGRDRLNREATESVTIKLIAGTPSVAITQPLDHAYFGPSAGSTFAVSGSFQGAAGSTVDVNGSAATLNGAAFSANVPFATGGGGLTPVVARVTEPGGGSGVAAIVVTKLAAAPKVIETFPAANAVEVDPGALLLVLFSAPMDRASLAGGAFRLEDASGATVSGTLFLDKDVLTFAPAALLTRGSHYTIRVTVAAKDVAGTALESESVAGFTVGTSAPSTPPSVTPVAAAFCGQTVTIKGTAPAGSRVQAESGTITIPATADAQGNFTINYPLSGQSGYATVRVRIVGSDGSLSPAAELTFRVDCVGPQVLNATYERTGANRIAIVFSEAIDPASATVAADGAIYMTLSDGRIVAGTASVSGSTVTVAPAEDLSARSFTLNVTTLVRDAIGNRLTAPYTQSFSLSTEQPPAGDGTGFISGEVYDATTGRPLPGASITIEVPATAFAKTQPNNSTTQQLKHSTTQQLKSSTLSVTTTTDGRGRYLVRLPEGAHTIRATMNGYTSVWRQIIVAAGAGVIPIDVRLTRLGDTKTSTGAALTLTHGGETTITRKVTLSIPGGVVASGKSVSLTAVGGQALTGLLPLGWSPVSSAEVVAETLTSAQLTFTVPATEVSAAAQNLTAVRYDELRDTWQVLTPVVNVASDGTASVAINAPGAYALVYPDKAAGLAQPALATAGAPLAGVPAPATDTPLTSRSFHLDPPIVLPNGRTVATLNIEGLGGATFPSGTAVQAYIDEELKLADGSTLLDPPFATDLLLYRSLNGEIGVSDFHLAPSPRAAQVILEVGFDHIRVVPYPGRLDRGTLVGAEGGRVPADDKVAIELPTGATPEPLRATASSLTQADLDAVGSIAGFRILGGFSVSLQRATAPPPQDLDGDGKPDAVPPVELFKAARATFTVDGSKLPSSTSSLILVELLDSTPYGKMVRLAAQMMPIDPVQSGATARFTTRGIDRSLLPVDGVIREGRYLLLAAEAPIAYATGSVHLGIGGSLLANARVSANALGVADLTRVNGIYNVPVVAAPAAPFTLTPRHVATGDGASYTHSSSAAAESVNKIDLNLVPQPPALTAVTVFAADASQLALSESVTTPNVALTTNVRASFSPAIDATSITDTSIVVVDAQTGDTVGGKATGDATGVTWSITPGQRLKNNNRYTVTISPLIRGTNGASLGKSVTYSFNTVVQITSTDVHADRIGITIPDANGVSRVFGTAGALPAGWQAVTVRRNIDFITRYQATAAADGSFSFNVGNGGDVVDRVKISDLIDLQVVNAAGNLAAILPLTPFVTEDHRGFVAPANIDVKFTSADGIAVSIAAGTFDQPTIVNIVATTQSAVADVPHLDQDAEYATSVRLDFDGVAHKPMEVELPVPSGFDTNGKSFILGYRGDSIRGPRIMAVDTLRIVDGKFSTTLDPALNGLRVSVLSNNARAGSQQVLTGKDLKNYLMRVQRSGIYAVVDIRVPVGGGVGWAVMDGLQAGYDLFWDTLASFYAADFYLFEGHGRVVVPVITGKPFTVVGVDSTTGLQGFSKVYDPIPVGDPNVGVTIPSPQDNTNGPYPIFGIPFRTEMADVNAEGVDIEEIRNFTLRLDNDQISVKPGTTPLPTDTKIEFLDITNGKYASGTAGQTLTFAGKAGDRVVLLVEQKEVDPSSALTVTFNEPIYVTGTTEDEIDTFLQTQLKLEKADEPPSGSGSNPSFTDITTQGHYTLDSGGRRLKIELPSSLQREAIYKLTLKKDIADRAGSGGSPGLKLAQGTKKDQNGNLQPEGGGNDLHLLFHVRKPGGKLATFDIASGFVRDLALNGNVLLVTSSSGGDGTGGALMAYDVADPASLNTANGGTPPVPLAKVTSVNFTSFWAVASDPHGRIYVTEQGSVLGSLHSYRIEDLVAANGGTVPHKSGAVTNWALGYSSSIGLLSNTILSDRPESIPRKLQILLQDDDKVYDGRDAFKNATGANETAITGSDVKKYSVSIPFDSNNPYLMQRVTVENLSLDMRWSADATPSGPATIQNIIALPTDRIKVSKNQRTYGVISHMGYGVGVYDLNAMESNDTPNRPSTYKNLQEQIVLSPGKNDDACFQPNTTTPKPPDYAIQEIYLSAEAAIRTDASAPNEIRVYAPDPYRGLLDMRFAVDKVQNNPDASITPTACQTRAPIGLILRATDPAANHPRVQALMDTFQSKAGRAPFIHFISVSPYSWRREAQDNAKGVRGSTPNAAVSRDYVLLAGGDLGVIVVEVGGSPAPNLPSYPPYWPLKNEHVADVIWVPGGAVAVRTIPRTNMAVIVDRSGRVLLADLSRLDERFDAHGNPIPGTPLFATVAKCLSLPASDPDGVGAYDPRIIWKSEPGIITGSLPPVVDGDTGMLYAGELLRKALKVVAALDPQIQMKVDIGEETGLSAVGGVVPLGISPPKSITDKIDALPACTSGGTARCKENASLGAFRLELTLPGGMVDSLTQSNKQLQLAVESERVFNAVSEQTPDGFPRSHLRRFKRDGSAEDPVRVATNFKMQRVVPNDPALEQALRRQRGFNKFISPWIVALDDPRASAQYNWNGATADQKKDAGCEYCSRPKYLDGKTESDGVYELWTNGRLIAVRPEFIASSGATTDPDSIFANTPYEYLGKENRLVTRFATIIADTVRPTDVRVAGQNPPIADGMLQEALLLHSGEMATASVDLVAGGRAGFDVFFDRNYRSRTIGGTFLGLGWESSMFKRLRALPNGDVELRDGGEIWLFKPKSSGDDYDSPKGLFVKLSRAGTGWILLDQKWRVTNFDEFGRLSSAWDEFYRSDSLAASQAGLDNGNIIRYLYDDKGRLAQIIDPVKRSTTLTYWKDSEASQTGAYPGLLKEIKDWRDRTVQYEYDNKGQLKTAKLPEVKAGQGVPSQYEFTGANRPRTQYGYKAFTAPAVGATPDQAFNDYLELQNLETITEPSEVASGGDPRVTFTYDETADPLRRDHQKIQKWATGESASFIYNSPTDVETTDVLGQKRKYTLTDKSQYDKRIHIAKSTIEDVPVIELSGGLPARADLNMSASTKALTSSYQFNDEGLHTQEDYPNGLSIGNNWVATGNSGPGMVLKDATQTGALINTEKTVFNYDSDTASGTVQGITRTAANGSGDRDAQTPSRERLIVETKDENVGHKREYHPSGLLKTSQTTDGSGNVTQDVSPLYYSADATLPISRSRAFYINKGNNVLKETFLYSNTGTGGYHVQMSDVIRGTTTDTDYDSRDRKNHEVIKDGASGVVLSDESFGYDASGRQAYSARKQKDVGLAISSINYDSIGREKARTLSGTAVSGSASTLTTTTTYDLQNLKITRYDPSVGGGGPNYEVSTLDRLGRPANRERTGSGGASLKSVYGYDSSSAQVYVSDTTRIASLRQLDEVQREVASVASDGIKTQNRLDQWGQVIESTQTDSGGAVIGHFTQFYTRNGRLRGVNDEIDNGGRTRQTRYAWDDGDITTSTRVGQTGSVYGVTFPSGKVRTWQATHDAAGRVKEELNGEATGASGSVDPAAAFARISYGYQGSVPNVVTRSEPIAGGSSLSITMYDGLGRPLEVAQAGGAASTRSNYDEAGNVTSYTAPGMKEETATFDSRGLATTRVMADGKTLQYQYDALGNLLNLQDESGEKTFYTPDGLGRTVQVQYADGTSEETRYEPLSGFVIATKDRAGQWLSFEYDANGRQTAVHEGQAVGGPVLTAYEYDGGGRLTAVRNKDAAIEYADFDLLGRPATTRTIRYASGSGLGGNKTVLDVHTQKHGWSIHDGERDSWRMPAAGSTAPAQDDPASPWLQTIAEEHDAGSNVVRQLAGGSLLSESVGRGVGKLLLRRQIVGSKTIETNYGFADGTTIATGVQLPSGSTANQESLFLRWTQTKVNNTVVGGSANNRDASNRVSQSRDQGLGDRISQWSYDDRGRLTSSWLNVPGPSPATGGVADTLIDADFRSGRTVPPILSPADHAKLGTTAADVEPLSWTATRNTTQQIGDRTTYLDGQPQLTRTYSFAGGRRTSDGKWTSHFDSYGHLASIDSVDAGRKIEYLWDPNDRMIGRIAYMLDGTNSWVLEDRTEVLARDGLPADSTFVWDPLADRLLAIYAAGKSTAANASPEAGLIRQYLHGDQGYDDPVRVLAAGSTGVVTYLPVIDQAGAGSLQAVMDSSGTMVERVVFADSYGDAPRFLQGPVVDRISLAAEKDANGNVQSVDVRVHLTETIDSSTVANGVRLASVDSSKNVVYQTSVIPTADDDHTIRWSLNRTEWDALANAGGASLEIAVGKTLRATAWGNATVTAAPDWTIKVYGTDSTSDYPVITRQSFFDVAGFFSGIPAGQNKSTDLYAIRNLYLAGTEESKTKLLFDFHALPFRDPATHVVYARARWYDPSTGSFLTPDPMGFYDSSNLYAYGSGDPVNMRDPSGECEGACVGALIGTIAGSGYAIYREIRYGEQFFGANGTWRYIAQGAVAGAAIGFAIETGGAGAPLSAKILAGTAFGAGLGGAVGSVAGNGDWATFGKSATKGGILGGVGAGTGAAIQAANLAWGWAFAGSVAADTYAGVGVDYAFGDAENLSRTVATNAAWSLAGNTLAEAGSAGLSWWRARKATPLPEFHGPVTSNGEADAVSGARLREQYMAQDPDYQYVPSRRSGDPINVEKANTVHNGVRYTPDGYPDFEPFAIARAEIHQTGVNSIDFKAANLESGIGAGIESHRLAHPGFTWHHHQNGTTMLLVPTAIHDAARHSGGASIARSAGGLH